VRDPILTVVASRSPQHGSRLSRGAWVVILTVVIYVAADALLRPALWMAGQHPPSLSSVPIQTLAWIFLAVPVTVYLYFWIPGSLVTLIPDLLARGVIVGPKDPTTAPIDEFARDTDDRFDHGSWLIAALVVAIGLAIWYWWLKLNGLASGTADAIRWQQILDLVAATPSIYCSTMIVFRLIVGIVTTDDLFDRYTIRVFAHHPDGAGGFGPLGARISYLARFGAVATSAVFLINLASFEEGHDLLKSPETVLAVGMLVLLVPLVLWAWLQSPHRAMLTARGEVIADVCSLYETVARRPIYVAPVPEAPEPGGTPPDGPFRLADDKTLTDRLKQATDLLQEIDRRAEEVEKTHPTWPIHIDELRRVSASVSAPLVAGLIGLLIGAIKELLIGR
jgi:hypothetical protein